MKEYANRIKEFIRTTFQSSHELGVHRITKKHFPFFSGWILIFMWLYSYFLPMGGFRFESNLYLKNVGTSFVYCYIWLIAVCMIPILFPPKRFLPWTIYSVLTALGCFTLLRYTGENILSKGIMILASICIGHIFVSNLYGFFVILNNSEKFFSMVLAVLLPRLLMRARPILNKPDEVFDPASIVVLAIILLLGVCTWFFRYHTDEQLPPEKGKAPANAYSLMPLIFVVLTLNDVIAPASLKLVPGISRGDIENYYLVGIGIGIAGVVLLQKQFRVNIYNMLNISFALLAIGFVVHIISLQTGTAALVSAVCFGSSYAVGFVNIYYLAGLMTKKLQSIRFYKVIVVLSSLYYVIAFLALEVVKDLEMLAPPVFMGFASICLVILFFLLTPFFIKMLYSGEWIDDTYRQDVTLCSRLDAKLMDYKLTPAEMEVCRLLLEGFTMRQIAGIQSKAYATINTYCTSIYRKLHINSRSELLMILQEYTVRQGENTGKPMHG